MPRTDDDERPIWIHSPLLNWRQVYGWLIEAGVKKAIPPEHLHYTQATVRVPVRWDDLRLRTTELVIPAGLKTVQIFAYTIKAMTFGHDEVRERHSYLAGIFPQMDHAVLRPHVSLYKGGRMPRGEVYTGPLVFGPEQADVFDAANAMGIKHVVVADRLAQPD